MLQAGRSRFRVPTRLLNFFSIYLILSAALGPGVYSASNKNEYQKQKKIIYGRGRRVGLTSTPSVSRLSSQCANMLYFRSGRSKLQYASAVCNSITSTDANKLGRIQQTFTSVCFHRFSPPAPYSYTFAREKLSLHFRRKGRHHFDALLVCSGPSRP
jgi:hypothetical protein